MHLLDVALELLDAPRRCSSRFPAGLHGVEAVLYLGELFLELLETVAGELVVLFLEGHLFDLHLHDAAAQIVELRRHRVDLRADHRAGLIDEVDGLVRQETVGDIAVGERRRGDKRVVVDANAVIDLIALLQAAQDGNGVLDRRLVDLHGLEAALEGGVLFDILAVLVERGRADAVQLAASQHRLEEVAGIHAALGLARADDGVQLIDEQQDAPSLLRTSSNTALSAPQTRRGTFAPATSAPISSEKMVVSFRPSGTSPRTIRWARPSAMAVLPTPGSPMSTGLFFVLRDRMRMTLRIS